MTLRFIRALPVAALLVTAIAAPASGQTVVGTNGPDVLVGTAKADNLAGNAGADKLYGKAGADRLSAGKDSVRDLLYGGPGPDLIFARYHDWVYGGEGNDTIRILELSYTLGTYINCGPGYDTVYFPYGWTLPTTDCERIVR